MPTNSNPDVTEQIRLGVANSCLKMPKDPGERRDLIQGLFEKAERVKESVAEVKEEIGVAGHEKRLHAVYGVAKATQRALKILHPMKPGDRAVVLTQIGILAKDLGWADKDLVTLAEEAEATAGQAQDDQGSIFDKTSTGKAMGGEPHHMEPAVTAPEPAPTPGIDLAEAQRIYEENLAAYKAKGGKGRKPKALVEAEAAVTAAAQREAQQHHDAQHDDAAHDDPDDFEDDIPEPTSRSPLAGATGQGSYTIG
ncbi:hypothetical protein [Methylobacterium indicum]|uniref:Uncharacterized protein n=1 Tax=Methylobacterium indicum TaxID=1775910 RepID=A0ABR5HEN4_9HYPH|nr:hypothetical protein [Methylobacterium indicum]KMO18883.1 hypothetical protein QR78_14290 [Methylobacterium indicum]KMO25041.1 hypothetical protein QR79_09680 [Methylobacterium indicum]